MRAEREEAFLSAAAAGLGAAAAATAIRSYDFFWHLAAGRWIVANGRIPETDPFSFTAVGTAWVDHGWLYQVLLFGLWRWTGLLGPWIGKLLAAAALAWVTLRHLRRRGVSPGPAILLVLGGLAGASPRFTDRPEMVTLLFTALAASWLCGRGRAPLLLIPLAVIWANVHAGSILAPLLAGAALAGSAAERLVRAAPDRPGRRRLGILAVSTVGSAGALLLNPYGIDAVLVPIRLAPIVGRFPNPEWTRSAPEVVPGLYVAVAGLAVVTLLRRDRVRGVPTALAVVGAALALQYVRNVGVFFVLFPFALAPFFAGRAPRFDLRIRWALIVAGLAGFLLAPAVGSVGPGLEPGRYPVRACDFLQQHGIDGRRFNEVRYGGYLIWRFPGQPVFIDGRNEVYPDLLERLFAALEHPARFWALTDEWGLQAAVLRYPPEGQLVRYPGPPPRMVRRSWSEVYFPRREWALVFWDDTAMVRVRRSAVDEDWLGRHELRLNPDDWPWVRDRILRGEADLDGILRELDVRIARDPGGRRARRLRAELEALRGDVE